MGSYFDVHLNSNIAWFLQSQKESYAKKAFYNKCFTSQYDNRKNYRSLQESTKKKLYQNKKSLIHTHIYLYIISYPPSQLLLLMIITFMYLERWAIYIIFSLFTFKAF